MIPAAFDYQAPASVEEAVKLLDQLGDRAKVLAGGHSLIPIMKLRLAQPEVLVDIGRIGDLRQVRRHDGRLAIGALVTHAEVTRNGAIREGCPLLAETASEIGDIQVRNRGTLGGALAHADPAADYPATILALDAEIVAQGPAGRRTIRASDFFTGMLSTALAPNELLVEVLVPTYGRGTGGAYLKMPNKASHYAVVGVAALARLEGGRVASLAVAITGAGAQPIRARAVERALQGQAPSEDAVARAAGSAAEGLDLLSDVHGSAEYRAHIARVFTRRAILEAVRRAGG
ncbi:MAG TPA: xanthine dehydrogenase family protein subunit M [Chloroflexota bacterium]|jgi:carbon-monoxide dehydrogenase medium subunit|nr:xanthine dehydrogenase family protein subunit M [Chloroflexota bacterium]